VRIFFSLFFLFSFLLARTEADDGGAGNRALGNRLGCTEGLAAETSLTASGKNEKSGYGDSGFVNVQEVLGARSRPMPTLRIDGPYGALLFSRSVGLWADVMGFKGAPAEDVFKNEGATLEGLRLQSAC
jgi:hypothetical protein